MVPAFCDQVVAKLDHDDDTNDEDNDDYSYVDDHHNKFQFFAFSGQ